MSSIDDFEMMGLKDDILRGIYKYGWEKPSGIQCTGIPAILQNRDVILQAQSGTGKTGTFAIAMLQRIDDLEGIQGIIILNTRELADQVYTVIKTLGNYLKVNFVKCVGQSQVDNRLAYQFGPTVLIGTPGKICTTLRMKFIHQPLNIKLLVIDECDKTLEKDFIPTIKEIVQHTCRSTNIVLSSATLNPDIIKMSKDFMTDPITIFIDNDKLSLDGIIQYKVICDRDGFKFDTMLDIFKIIRVGQCVIFVNSKRTCDDLEARFSDKGFTISSIHGDMEQQLRDRIMDEFRRGKIRMLLTTDLTARGIDVPGISLVFNYELPNDPAQYIHRVGRTGRYGKKGCAINLIGGHAEVRKLGDIEKCYGIKITDLPSNFKNIME